MITNITILVIGIAGLCNSIVILGLLKSVKRLEKKTNWYQR